MRRAETGPKQEAQRAQRRGAVVADIGHTMTDTRKNVAKGLSLLEESILQILREAYPAALKASEIRDELGIQDPRRGVNTYLTDSLIKRLEERGLVEQTRERGPWKLTVT